MQAGTQGLDRCDWFALWFMLCAGLIRHPNFLTNCFSIYLLQPNKQLLQIILPFNQIYYKTLFFYRYLGKALQNKIKTQALDKYKLIWLQQQSQFSQIIRRLLIGLINIKYKLIAVSGQGKIFALSRKSCLIKKLQSILFWGEDYRKRAIFILMLSLSNPNNSRTLSELLQQTKNKPKKGSQSSAALQYLNPVNKQINVVSPFYDRDKCPVKGPCPCPFHRKKRFKMINHINYSRSKYDKSQIPRSKKMIKFNTEQPEKNLENQSNEGRNKFKQSNLKTLSNFTPGQNDNYEDISHKVQCVNDDYFQFLKNNGLFNLTGKIANNFLRKSNELSDESFMDSLARHFQADPQFWSKTLYSRSRKKKVSFKSEFVAPFFEKKSNRNQSSQKIIQQERERKILSAHVIKRIYQIIQGVLNGTKKMSINKIKRLRTMFSRLIDEQKQTNSGVFSDNYASHVAFLNRFDDFVSEHYEKSKNKSISKGQSTSYKSILQAKIEAKMQNKAGRKKYRKSIFKQSSSKNIKTPKNKSGTKSKVNSSKNTEKKIQFSDTRVNKQQSQVAPQLQDYALQQDSEDNEKYINYQQQYDGSNPYAPTIISRNKRKGPAASMMVSMSGLGVKKVNKFDKKNSNQLLYEQYKQNVKINEMAAEKATKNKHFQINQSHAQVQLPESQKAKQIVDAVQAHISHRNSKQLKLQQILQHLKKQTDSEADNQNDDEKRTENQFNYYKMKKVVEINKRFIRKMQKKLIQLDLGVFVIESTDSLITRKKKIRFLREIIEEGEQSADQAGSKFVGDMLKYVDIYDDHCKMMMNKGIKKKQQDIDFNYGDVVIPEIWQGIKWTNSLKFIDLVQNRHSDKKEKLEQWVPITQYVTKDYSKQKSKKFTSQRKQVQEILYKRQSLPPVNEDYLLQKDLESTFKVQNYQFPHIDNSMLQSPNRRQKNMSSFEQKISYFKKKLLTSS